MSLFLAVSPRRTEPSAALNCVAAQIRALGRSNVRRQCAGSCHGCHVMAGRASLSTSPHESQRTSSCVTESTIPPAPACSSHFWRRRGPLQRGKKTLLRNAEARPSLRRRAQALHRGHLQSPGRRSAPGARASGMNLQALPP